MVFGAAGVGQCTHPCCWCEESKAYAQWIFKISNCRDLRTWCRARLRFTQAYITWPHCISRIIRPKYLPRLRTSICRPLLPAMHSCAGGAHVCWIFGIWDCEEDHACCAVLCCDEQTKGNFATLMSRHTFWCDVLSAARSTRTWHAFVSVFGGFGIRRLPVY
jgi:hypothetical protein